MKVNLVAVRKKLKRNEEIISDKLQGSEANIRAVVENVVAEVDRVQEQLSKQEERYE